MALSAGNLLAGLSFSLKAKDAPAGTASASTVARPLYFQSFNDVTTIRYGTGSGQFNSLIVQDRSLVGAAAETLNLFDGSLTDVFNRTAPLQNVKLLVVYQIANPTGTTAASSLTVGNAASAVLRLNFGADADTWTVYLGGAEFKAGRPAGYTVDNTHKLFLVTNDDATNTATYRIVIAGVAV